MINYSHIKSLQGRLTVNKILLYKIAYRMLENSTPLNIDCGSLCGKACCKGDRDMGMYLFPGEEHIFEVLPEFFDINPTGVMIGDIRQLLAVCSGKCSRSMRPLACRIFPLIPYISSTGRLFIIMDPRSLHICPLSRYSDIKTLNQFFVRDVRRVFRILMQDREIRRYIEHLSRILDDYRSLFSSLAKTGASEEIIS